MSNPTYSRWADVPEYLQTKTQLGRDGLKPGGAVQAVISTQYGDWNLYDLREALPKRTMTEAQRTALDKARKAAEAARCCEQCGEIALLPGEHRPERLICEWCQRANQLAAYRKVAARWARDVLAQGTALILDTETTGLEDDAEIIEIALVRLTGEVVLKQLVRPTRPFPPEASAIHGLREVDVQNAPSWAEVWPQVERIFQDNPNLIIYNAAYDKRLITQSCTLAGIPAPSWKWLTSISACAMEWYAQYVGEWSDYYQSFRWLPLPSAGHRAVDDCQATLTVLQEMAASLDSQELTNASQS